MNDETSRRVRDEFTRQAGQMAAAPAFRAQPVLERFIRAVGDSTSDRVLDVACGPGIVAAAIAPHVGQVVGIDATPEMIRLARERFGKAGLTNGRFELGSAEQLPFGNASFDQVVTRLSFHHLQEVPMALREMRRLLRPGGRLTVADIISVEEGEQAALHNALEQLRDPSHVRFFSQSGLLRLIQDAGFSVLHQNSWTQERSFDEWAAIVADPARTQPLESVMRALARAGQACGISLHDDSGKLVFVHTWLMVIADSGWKDPTANEDP